MESIDHAVAEGFVATKLRVRRKVMATDRETKKVPDEFFASVFDERIIDELYEAISQQFCTKYDNSSNENTRRHWKSFTKDDHIITFFAHFVLRPAMGWSGSHEDVRTASLRWINDTFDVDLDAVPLLIKHSKRFANWYSALNAIAKDGTLWTRILERVQDMALAAVIVGSLAAIDETLVFATHGEFDIYIDEIGVIYLPVIMHIPRKPKRTSSLLIYLLLVCSLLQSLAFSFISLCLDWRRVAFPSPWPSLLAHRSRTEESLLETQRLRW